MRDKRTRTMDDTNMDTRNYTSPDSLVLYTRDNCSHKCISFCFFFFAFQSLCHFHKYIYCFLMSVWIGCMTTKHQSPDDNVHNETCTRNETSRILPFNESARILPKKNADKFDGQNLAIPINSHKVHVHFHVHHTDLLTMNFRWFGLNTVHTLLIPESRRISNQIQWRSIIRFSAYTPKGKKTSIKCQKTQKVKLVLLTRTSEQTNKQRWEEIQKKITITNSVNKEIHSPHETYRYTQIHTHLTVNKIHTWRTKKN